MKKVFLSLIILINTLMLVGCKETLAANNKIIYAMDTYISATIYSNDTETAKNELEDINQIYQTYSRLCDNYKPYSNIENIYSLNNSRSITADDALIEVLYEAMEAKVETDGYFEPLIGNLVSLWKNALFSDEGNPYIPSENDITACLNEIATSEIVINGNNVTITGDADIDLGGIAKGFATEKVYEYLEANNITNYMIDAGSSNILLGEKPNDIDFSVGMTRARETGYYQILKKSNCAIVTSSIKEQNVIIDEEIYHHIIDPKTGYPKRTYDSITIIGNDSGILDAYSTAMFSMPIEVLNQFAVDKVISMYAYKDSNLVTSYEKAS